MKNTAAYILGKHQITFHENPLRELEPDEVLAKGYYLGLCGSDQHMYEGAYGGPHTYPVIPGHEWAGEIVAVGSQVKGYKVGDRVSAEAAMWCGHCSYCEVDKNICLDIEKCGLMIDGYAQNYAIIKNCYLYHLPENVDFQLGCLAEPYAVGYHAIRKGMGKNPAQYADKKVVIVGAGPIGLTIAMLLIREFGFKHVYVSDVVKERLARAEEFGATACTLEVVDTEAKVSYHEMYDIDGFDFAFESTGIPEVVNNILGHMNPLGSIICLAPIPNIQLTGGLLVLKSLKLIGSIGGGGDFQPVLNAFAKDPDYYRRLITHSFPLTEMEKAIEVQKTDPTRIKIILDLTQN